MDPQHPGFVQLEDYPELITVLTQAVDAVIIRSNINRERDADLVEDIERAAAAAAITIYQQTEISASQTVHAAAEARRTKAHLVAANAEMIADRVTAAAAEVHNIAQTSADQVARSRRTPPPR